MEIPSRLDFLTDRIDDEPSNHRVKEILDSIRERMIDRISQSITKYGYFSKLSKTLLDDLAVSKIVKSLT